MKVTRDAAVILVLRADEPMRFESAVIPALARGGEGELRRASRAVAREGSLRACARASHAELRFVHDTQERLEELPPEDHVVVTDAGLLARVRPQRLGDFEDFIPRDVAVHGHFGEFRGGVAP